MSALAYAQQLPPLIWGAAFFAGLFAIGVVRLIAALAATKRAQANVIQEFGKPPLTVNPLRKDFSHERINLADFWGSLTEMRVHKGQSFRNCHIVGPGAIYFGSNCHITNSNFATCDKIYLPYDTFTQAAIVFEGAIFDGCYFAQVTMYLAKSLCDSLLEDARDVSGLREI